MYTVILNIAAILIPFMQIRLNWAISRKPDTIFPLRPRFRRAGMERQDGTDHGNRRNCGQRFPDPKNPTGFYGSTSQICFMSGPSRILTAGSWAVIVLVLSLCAGCLATTVGDTGYENQSVRTTITHTGAPADLRVQVTAYRITGFSQEPFGVFDAPVSLMPGENTVFVPADLPPGSYKLYIYVLGDNDRKTAVIRDITV